MCLGDVGNTQALRAFEAEGKLVTTDDRVRLTDAGFLLLNDIVIRLLESESKNSGIY